MQEEYAAIFIICLIENIKEILHLFGGQEALHIFPLLELSELIIP